jgi:glycosyltransferase involved in cell wall biosynthesis
MLARAPAALLRRRRVIGVWAWELPVAPPGWADGARYVHEAWAGSPFTAAALEPIFPGRIRMVPLPLGLLNALAPAADRASFGLPEAAVLTVMVFALGSSFTRKNPLAGIAAFKRAFGTREDQVLVVKFSGAAAFPREAAQILAQAAPNIRFFGESWPPGQVTALLACADIVLSLHRSEGFGLVPAEAMLMGKPVVATGWSGNMAFMDATSAALVGYELVPVDDPTGVYARLPGAVWAEPDIVHAAEWLRRLGDDPVARKALGEAGRAHAARALNGEEMRNGLEENGIE